MKAVIIRAPGEANTLKIEEWPVPTPKPGQVRIAVKAFGLNRSELFTRRGHSPLVRFPRVLGIEAVGVVDEAPGGEFVKGDVVTTVMGGMGRQFDGGYAQFTCVPAANVVKVETQLAWEVPGALPEMLQTAWGSLFSALQLKNGQGLLVRGATTLRDSLLCAGRGGVVCMSGIVGNKWTIDSFAPMDAIPNRVSLTTYSGEVSDFVQMPFQSLVDDVATGALPVKIGRIFTIDDIVEAHRCMESNAAEGKIVVLT